MRQSHPERRTPTLRQFAMVLLAITWFAVLLPVGARAAGQLVTLVDPIDSSKTRVDDGKLRVGDGNGSLTVDGSVRVAAPVSPFTVTAEVKAIGPTAVLVAQRRGPHRLAISAITGFGTSAFQVVRYRSFVVHSSTFACPADPSAIAAAAQELDIPLATSHAPMSAAYPSPVVFFTKSTSSTTSCLYVSSAQVGAADFDVTTTMSGYWDS